MSVKPEFLPVFSQFFMTSSGKHLVARRQFMAALIYGDSLTLNVKTEKAY
jgi:hypothetical protein